MYIKVEGKDETQIRFPVLPPSWERQLTLNNQQVDVNRIGTVNLIGKPGLQTIQVDAFFPHEYNSSFCQVGEDALLDPYTYVHKIEAMEKKICRLIITGGAQTDKEDASSWKYQDVVNILVLIDSFNYAEKDGTRDVSFSLICTEYKVLEKSRVDVSQTKSKKYKTKAKDTLKKISKKQLKDAKKGKVIYNNNKKKCKKAFKAYAKQNKKKALVNKMMKKGVILTIPAKS